MTSLHDRYYSEINKNYIFGMACKIIKGEYGVDISEDQYFKDIYEKNINDAFQANDTDDIVVLNRKLLLLQMNSYMGKKKQNIGGSSIILNNVNRIITGDDSFYNFNIETYDGVYNLKYLIIPKENNSLFSNPIIIITINNYNQYLKLNSSYDLNNRTFLEYVPINKESISLNEKTYVKIRDSLNISLKKNGYLSISNIYEDYIEVPNNTYKIGDSLKINGNIFIIKNIINNKDIYLDNMKDFELTEGDKILNITESFIIVLDEIRN
jgi:hypothetical protein